MQTYKQILKLVSEMGTIELYNIEKAVNQEFIKRGFTDRLKLKELLK